LQPFANRSASTKRVPGFSAGTALTSPPLIQSRIANGYKTTKQSSKILR